uniref:4-hydroxybenzoate polyprenyltransferase n=1 Tax=Schlesneria paludicola TaxID=360056 RepID=A0A7C4QU45_9PLAN
MLGYLQLLRLPTVFTALADIFLGYSLTHRELDSPAAFGWLLLASAGLYLSGMVFNDVFDARQDARERPGRPIPSGRVPMAAAIALGAALMLGGVVSAGQVGRPSLMVAGLLVAAILGYDGVLKRTPLGPLGMGACRFLNVMLGASDYQWWFALWARPQLVCAIGLGVYIVGVTWFARTEARQSQRGQLLAALAVLDLGLVVLAWLMCTWHGLGELLVALALLTFIAASLNLRALAALRDPTPARVQGMVKLMLLNYVMVNATLVYWKTGDGTYALATACLVIPAVWLGRYIPMT